MRLLGGAAAERDGQQLSLPPPVGRLLAFLAVRPGPRDREAVAAHLWPCTAGPAARANLRTAVWALRKAVGAEALIASRTAIGLRPEAVTVDLADCRRRAAAGDVAAAAALCNGELLPGYADDWAEAARRQLRAELAEALGARSASAERDGDAAAAARWSRLRCDLDPLDEAAHADLVRQLAAAGDRAGALVAGREVTARLQEELGVRPGPLLRAALAEARGAPGGAALAGGPAAARPLFGRAAELRALMSAWTAARAGRGHVILVTGEAGIGKTRLVTELARRADNAGARIAVGAGVDVGGAAPLAMWQELVPQLARTVSPPPGQADWPAELGRLAPDVAARLGRDGPPPPVSSPELERLRMFEAVLRLVEWAAAGRPVLLVAEDVHRADPASMQLCAHIGGRLASQPVLFVLTRRDRPERPAADALLADLAGRGVEVAELDVGPLSAVELAAVARSVADLTDVDVDQVIRAADGNPLLAVESARALAAGSSAPPPNLRAAVRAATGALPRPARDLAEALAAAGRELSAAELAALPAGRPRRRRGGRARHRPGVPVGRRAAVPACAAGRGRPGRPGRARPPPTSSSRWRSRRPPPRPARSPPRWPATCTARAATIWPGPGGSGRRTMPGRWARCRRRPGSGPRRWHAIPVRWPPGWSWPRRSAGWARTPTSSASGRRPSSCSRRNGRRWPGTGGARCCAPSCAIPGRRSPPTSELRSCCRPARHSRCGRGSFSAPPGASRWPETRRAPPRCWTR